MTRLTHNNQFITFGGLHLTKTTYHIPTDGLQGEWLFSGNPNDTSGNGYNGSTVNSPVLISDRNGNPNSAYNCNNGYISIPSFNFSGFTSFSFWFKSSSSTDRFISNRFTQTNGFEFYINNSGILEYLQEQNLSRYYIHGTFSDNNWHHCVFMIDTYGKTINAYVDNDEKIISNGNPLSLLPINNNPFEFGYNGVDGIDDIRIYNRELTTSEIHSLFIL